MCNLRQRLASELQLYHLTLRVQKFVPVMLRARGQTRYSTALQLLPWPFAVYRMRVYVAPLLAARYRITVRHAVNVYVYPLFISRRLYACTRPLY